MKDKIKYYLSKVNLVKEVIFIAIAIVIFAVIYFLTLPVIGGWGFMFALVFTLGATAMISHLVSEASYKCCKTIVGKIFGISCIILIIAMIVIAIGGSPLFHSSDYVASINPVEEKKEDIGKIIPDFENIESNISLMDTSSARKLGDRTVGTLTEYVSQYDVSYSYTTIAYKNKIVKIAPLEHGSFFKAMKNDTIPGYVIIDPATNDAKFVEVEEGIKYSPSAYFGKDLYRHIRSEYKKEFLGAYYNFQIDEEGTPYYVVMVFDYTVWKSAKVPCGAIIVNAITGEMKKYEVKDLPVWVDQVFDGDTVSYLYNKHGKYINGPMNFADTGKTQVTDDYGYVQKDGDIYIYTGVTSVANDESNIGFILVNSRTGDCKYYEIPGAEEYSAMSAAEGVMQNYGYDASFPSLVMYKNIPVYVMVLKDDNGLVKSYGIVAVEKYTQVAVAETLEKAKELFSEFLSDTPDTSETDNTEKIEEKIVISSIYYITEKNITTVYVKDESGRCFKEKFREELILLDIGQEVTVKFTKTDKKIIPAQFIF